MIKDTTAYRDSELRKRFREILDSGINSDYYNWHTVVKLLSNQSAPCFFVTPKKAEQYVHSFYRGHLMVKNPIHIAMVKDLAETYERIKHQFPRKKAFEIWQDVVDSPAKSFYLKESTIKYIVYDYLRPHAKKSRC